MIKGSRPPGWSSRLLARREQGVTWRLGAVLGQNHVNQAVTAAAVTRAAKAVPTTNLHGKVRCAVPARPPLMASMPLSILATSFSLPQGVTPATAITQSPRVGLSTQAWISARPDISQMIAP